MTQTATSPSPAVPESPPSPAVEPRRGGLRRQLRRLADPRVIGMPLFWLSYLWYLLAGLFTYRAAESPTVMGAFSVVISATAGQLATFAVLLLAKYTYLRPRMARRHPSWTVLSFAIAALVGGITAQVVRQTVQPSGAGNVAPDLFNHTLYMTLALCIVGVVIVALREHQADVASLAAAGESLIATRVAGERALVAEQEQVEQRVHTLADELTLTLPRLSPADASAVLGHAAGDVIRPLSHELALTAPEASHQTVTEVPYPSWLATLRSVASGPPLIRPGLMGLMVMVLSARSTVASPSPSMVPAGTEGVQVSVDLAGLFEVLAQLALVFGVVWLLARVANWLLRRRSLSHPMNNTQAWEATIAATVGIAAASQVLLGIVFELLGFTLPLGTIAGAVQFTVALLAVVAVVAVINTTAMRRQAAVAQLARANEDLDWELRHTNEMLWRQRRELSTWLHGPIQASLNAGAIQLAQDWADSSEIDAAVKLFTDAVAKPPLGGQPKDITAELTGVRDTWAPLCEITWHLDEATAARIAADPACSSTLSDVIVEGCSNSVIHGGATTIDIELELDGERSIRLVLANNGSPIAVPSRGSGTAAAGAGVGAAGGAAAAEGAAVGGATAAGGAAAAGAAAPGATSGSNAPDQLGAVGAGGVGLLGDGAPLAGGGVAAGELPEGLGTQMLNDVCLEWKRVSTPEGTVLEAHFPVSDGRPTGYLEMASPVVVDAVEQRG